MPPLAMAADKSTHAGYSTYSAALTLTFKTTLPLDEAVYNITKCLTYGGPHTETFRDYCFYPEYHDEGGIHFHGVVYYSNKMHYNAFLTYWRRHLGFLKSKPLKDPLGWHFYCRKDNASFKCLRIKKHNASKMLKYSRTDWFLNHKLIVQV